MLYEHLSRRIHRIKPPIAMRAQPARLGTRRAGIFSE